MNRLSRLHQLAAATGDLLNFDYGNDDEPRNGVLATTAKAGAGLAGVGALGAGGLYAAGATAQRNRLASAMNRPGMSLMPGAQEEWHGAGGVGKTIGEGAQSAKGAIQTLFQKLRSFAPAAEAIAASARYDRIVELRAKTDKIIEFMEPKEFKDRFGETPAHLYRRTRPSENTRTALKGGAVGSGLTAAGIGGYYADKSIMSRYGKQNLLGAGTHTGIPTESGATVSARHMTGVTEGATRGLPLTNRVGRPKAYRAAGADLLNALHNRTGAAAEAARHAANVTAGRGGGLIESSIAGIRKGARVAFR